MTRCPQRSPGRPPLAVMRRARVDHVIEHHRVLLVESREIPCPSGTEHRRASDKLYRRLPMPILHSAIGNICSMARVGEHRRPGPDLISGVHLQVALLREKARWTYRPAGLLLGNDYPEKISWSALSRRCTDYARTSRTGRSDYRGPQRTPRPSRQERQMQEPFSNA